MTPQEWARWRNNYRFWNTLWDRVHWHVFHRDRRMQYGPPRVIVLTGDQLVLQPNGSYKMKLDGSGFDIGAGENVILQLDMGPVTEQMQKIAERTYEEQQKAMNN